MLIQVNLDFTFVVFEDVNDLVFEVNFFFQLKIFEAQLSLLVQYYTTIITLYIVIHHPILYQILNVDHYKYLMFRHSWFPGHMK